MGYNMVADACDYSIPQHRTRTYLLAFSDVNLCESYRFPDKVKLEKRVFDILWANEIDRDACKTYKLNFPETKLFEVDIRKLDAAKLENVDILTAGFPCQPSLKRQRNRFIEESIQEEMELTDGVAAIKEFESLSEDK